MKYLHRLQSTLGRVRHLEVLGGCDLWEGLHHFTLPGPGRLEAAPKHSISQGHMIVRKEKKASSAVPSGTPSECQVCIHKCPWRLVRCSVHQPLYTLKPIGVTEQRQDHSALLSGFRGSTCLLWPRQRQCCGKNLEV